MIDSKSKKHRICILSAGFPPLVGGLEIYAHQLAKRLAAVGHHVIVITTSPDSDTKKERSDGIEIIRVKPRRIRLARNIGINLLIRYIQIFKEVYRNRKRIDIIHALPLYDMGFIGAMIKRMIKKPLIVRDGANYGTVLDLQKNVLKKNVMRCSLINADKVYVDNPTLASNYSRLSKRKIQFLENPVDTRIFSPSGRRNRKPRILYVGRLMEFKGVSYLIKSMPEIIKKVNAELLIVGKGEEEQRLKSLAKELRIQENVRFRDFVPFESMPRLLNDADIVVQPSIVEETPNIILQAMSCGKATVCTDLVGFPGIMKNKITTLVIDPKNSEQITGAITTLLTNKTLRKRIESNARGIALEKLSWNNHIETIENLYEKIIG
jgi:glycosyltransferase involved in cell wall biosynthesis